MGKIALMMRWLAAAMGCACATVAAASSPPDIANARYGPHERHTLDVWQAKSAQPAALVVFIHGGGWHGGDKSAVPAALIEGLRARGIAVASINYRYTSMAKLPGPLHDAARAVQFLRAKAGEWKIDRARIGAHGVSAGGCSALWLAYHDELADRASNDPVARESSRVQAAVGISAQTSLEPEVVVEWMGPKVMSHPMILRAVGAKTVADVAARDAALGGVLRACSPIRLVSPGDAPVLLVFPTMGPLPAPDAGSAIHHAQFGVKLKAAADAAGVACWLRIEDAAAPAGPTAVAFLVEQLAVR